MDLNKLKVLIDVVDAGGIARAAIQRGVPQSQVSRQISALERHYGSQLLNRNGRGATLTELGQELLPGIRSLVEAAQQLDIDLRGEHRLPRGEVRVGLLSSFVEYVAAPFVQAVKHRLPEVRLGIVDGSSGLLEEWLASGRVDIAMVIRNQGSQSGDFVLKDAVILHLIGAEGQPAVSRPTICFRELDGLPLVLPGQPSGLRPLLDQAARQHGIDLNVVLESDSYAAQISLAASGTAYCVLGPYAVRNAVAQRRLQAACLIDPLMQRSIGLSTTTTRPSSVAIRETARILRSAISQVTRSP